MHPIFRTFASGAAVTFSSTVLSCYIALSVEGAANRTLYRFFPHLYRDVKYAYGIPHLNEGHHIPLNQSQCWNWNRNRSYQITNTDITSLAMVS